MSIVAVASVVASIASSASSVYSSLKGMFSGTSPRVTWEEANSVCVPLATKITSETIGALGEDKIPAVFALYAQKVKGYIANSPHNPEQREFYQDQIQTQAVQMSNGFRSDAFPFDVLADQQLAWAVYLHSMWIFEGSSKDEIPNDGAMRKFLASLEPTLFAAIREATGQQVPATPTPGGTVVTTTTKTASVFSSPGSALLLAGAAIGLIVLVAKGKYK